MRQHAEATWGKWTPAESPERHISGFSPTGHQIVVVDDSDVGVLAYEDREDCIYLMKLYLLDAYRGAGLGSKLLERVFGVARKTGKTVKLHTLSVNVKAVAFYTKHGFNIESQNTERVHMVKSAA